MNKKEILGLCEFVKLHGYENTDNISKFIFGLQQKNKQLKDNWNKLREFIVKEYYMYLPLEASTKPITILIDKMQEIEGDDNNE